MVANVRGRARDLLRREIAEAASEIFAHEGFDEISVEEVAQRIGISRATFFRYFTCKEDAVLATVKPLAIDYASQLADCDEDETQSHWALLRCAFQPVVDSVKSDSSRTRRRVQMLLGVPSLRARLTTNRHEREDALAMALEDRLDDPLTARLFSVLGLSALDVTWREWAESSHDSDFGDILNQVFSRLDPE